MTLDGHLHQAPLSTLVKSILDVGCGSGAWTVDMALRHPEASTVGVDLTPPQATSNAPPNCTFVRANAEQQWTFLRDHGPFDFIFARMLGNGMHDWPAFFAKCYNSMMPGGWLEVPDVRVAGIFSKKGLDIEESAIIRWARLFETQARLTGIDPDANLLHTKRMREAGFVNISEYPVEWWIGGDCGETEKERAIGARHQAVIFDLIDGMTDNILQYERDWGHGKAQELARLAKQDLLLNQAQGQYYLQLYAAPPRSFLTLDS